MRTLRARDPYPTPTHKSLQLLEITSESADSTCLLQPELAELLGVDHGTVTNWELSRTAPALQFLPDIVRFLGYAPWADGGSIAERLLAYRLERGLPQEVFARLLRIDPDTLSR
jgi:transcriptional regulator with XRE-family HTH domain